MSKLDTLLKYFYLRCMKQIILVLLVFTIGCEPKEEKINLETFLIGDIWCYDNVKNKKICFEFTSDAVVVNVNKVLHKDTIQFRQQGDDDKNIIKISKSRI